MKQSLEEGLDRSAQKRGFHGAERHRYIGGALRNMEKKGEISMKPRAKRATVAKSRPTSHHKAETKQATPAPAKKEYAPSVKRGTLPAPGKTALPRKPGKTGFRGKPKPREQLILTVKVNKVASDKVPNHAYQLYSIYKGKELYKSGTYRKMATAKAEAKIEMDRHNHPRGVHARPGFL